MLSFCGIHLVVLQVLIMLDGHNHGWGTKKNVTLGINITIHKPKKYIIEDYVLTFALN
jgi:hypothetical protein